VVLDEFYKSDTHVEDAVGWLRDHAKPAGPIFAEHEPSDIEKFKTAGYAAEKADKSLDAGIAEVRWRLESDGNAPVDTDPRNHQEKGFITSRDGGGPVGRVGLLISENCPRLIREFQGYKEDHVGKSQAVDHGLDSLRYLCLGVASGSHQSIPEPGGTWYDPL
jgi:hypothetical protein